MNLLISACLLGIRCRYDACSKPLDCLDELNSRFTLIPACPEVLGGLATPRCPAERVGDRVITKDGADVTEPYRAGAGATLRIAKSTGCTVALLKEKSPSCGKGLIYDGTFTRTVREGMGVCAEMLDAAGIRVFGESRAEELIHIAEAESEKGNKD